MFRILGLSLIVVILVGSSVGCIQHFRKPTFQDGKKIIILSPRDEVVAEITDIAEIKRISKTFRESKLISSEFEKSPPFPQNQQEWLQTKVYNVDFYDKDGKNTEGVAIDNDFTMFWFGPYYYKPSEELKKVMKPYIK